MLVAVWGDCAFLLPLSRKAGEASRDEKRIGKKRGWRSCLSGRPSPAHRTTRRGPHGVCKRTRNVRLGQSFFPAARRPWIVSLPQERFRGAFFCGKTV